MTEKELCYHIMNIHAGGRLSDDFIPSYNQVLYMVKYVRAMFIRRDLSQNWAMSKLYEQDLGEIKMVSVDKAECPDLILGYNVLKTSKELPRFVRLKTKDGITYAGAIDKQTKWDMILSERSPYISYSKYTSKIPRFYLQNGYGYVITTDEIAYMNIRGILENPEDANAFLCTGESCFTSESQYPFPIDMVGDLTNMILSKEMNFMLRTAPDTENNSINDTERQPTNTQG